MTRLRLLAFRALWFLMVHSGDLALRVRGLRPQGGGELQPLTPYAAHVRLLAMAAYNGRGLGTLRDQHPPAVARGLQKAGLVRDCCGRLALELTPAGRKLVLALASHVQEAATR